MRKKSGLGAPVSERGFNSIVVVPIRYRDKTLGALHLADEREGMFPLKTVESLEGMALIIGEALYRLAALEEQQVRLASAVESTAEAVVITSPLQENTSPRAKWKILPHAEYPTRSGNASPAMKPGYFDRIVHTISRTRTGQTGLSGGVH